MTNIVTAPNGAKFTLFFSIRSPFSNFHPCRMEVVDQNEDGNCATIFFSSTEQYYMYYKAISFGDVEIADQILREREARKIKMLGRKVKNFDANKWNDICEDVMRRGNIAKYTQNDELRKKLFYTHGSILVECSPNDKIWGIGMSIFDPNAVDQSKWRGQNKLGYILTNIREDLWKKPEYAQEVNEILGMLKNFDVIACRIFPPPNAPQRSVVSQSPSPFIPTSSPSTNSPFLPTDATQMMMFAQTPIQANTPFSIPLPPERWPNSPNAADYTKSSPMPESFYCFEKDQPKTPNNAISPASIENSTKTENDLSYEEDKRRTRRNSKKGDEQHLLMSKDDCSHRYAHQQQQYSHSASRRGWDPESKRKVDDGESKRPPSSSSLHHHYNLRSRHHKRNRRSPSYSSSSPISSESRSRSRSNSRSGSRRRARKESDDIGMRRRRNEHENRRRRKSSTDDESRYNSSKQGYDLRSNGRSGNRNLSDSDAVASADIRHSRRRRHQRQRMHSATSSSSTSDSCASSRTPKRNNRPKRSRLISTESKQSLNENATNDNMKKTVEEDDARNGDEFTSLLQKLREKPSGLWEKMNTNENAEPILFKSSTANNDPQLMAV